MRSKTTDRPASHAFNGGPTLGQLADPESTWHIHDPEVRDAYLLQVADERFVFTQRAYYAREQSEGMVTRMAIRTVHEARGKAFSWAPEAEVPLTVDDRGSAIELPWPADVGRGDDLWAWWVHQKAHEKAAETVRTDQVRERNRAMASAWSTCLVCGVGERRTAGERTAGECTASLPNPYGRTGTVSMHHDCWSAVRHELGVRASRATDPTGRNLADLARAYLDR
jgi:hypothetical protein